MSRVLRQLSRIETQLQTMQRSLPTAPGLQVVRTVEIGGQASDAILSGWQALKQRELQG